MDPMLSDIEDDLDRERSSTPEELPERKRKQRIGISHVKSFFELDDAILAGTKTFLKSILVDNSAFSQIYPT